MRLAEEARILATRTRELATVFMPVFLGRPIEAA